MRNEQEINSAIHQIGSPVLAGRSKDEQAKAMAEAGYTTDEIIWRLFGIPSDDALSEMSNDIKRANGRLSHAGLDRGETKLLRKKELRKWLAGLGIE